MQEELENKSVVLTTKAAKVTGRALARLMRFALKKMKESKDKVKPGRQSYDRLAKSGSLSNVEITDDNIKSFDPIAREFKISYALKRDDSSEPPHWFVFFRAKDEDAMTAAFKKYTAQMIKREKDRPSVREDMHKKREAIKNVVRDKTKHKLRGELEL